MTTSLFRSPVFWGGLAAVAVGTGAYLHHKRGRLLGRSNPTPVLVKKNPAKTPAVTEVRVEDGVTMRRYETASMNIDERLKLIQQRVWDGVNDPRIRKLALQITRQCGRDDGACEAQRVFDYVKANVRYTGDIGPVLNPKTGKVEAIDLYQKPWVTLEYGGGDCLPLETLVLRDDFEMVSIAELTPGDRIMADGVWTTVQDRWFTGEKPVLALDLSNGCTLRCTPEHRIFRNVAGRMEEIRAAEARVGDDLVTAEWLPTAETPALVWPEVAREMAADDLAWLLGVYVADGWTEAYRFAISGRDGKPKEDQKRRVQALMEAAGVATRWHEKYLAVNDASLAQFFAACGGRAWLKRVPSIACTSTAEVEALLSGLAADADVRNGVFGTTSGTLALQLRVLHRMLGRSVHMRRVDDHGGFGEHPIWRVTPRAADPARRDQQFARVRAIRDGGLALCGDLTTDRGKFWLPESDTIVHNCDDHVGVIASLLTVIGHTVRLRVSASSRFGDWEHIYPVTLLPKHAPKLARAVDTTLPWNAKLGSEARYGKARDYLVEAPV